MTGIVLGAALLAGGAVGWWAPAAVAGIGAVWLAIRFRRRHVAVAVVAVVVAAVGASRAAPDPEIVAPDWIDTAGAVRGRVSTVPVSDGRWQRFVLDVEEVGAEEAWGAGEGRLDVIAPLLPAVELGDTAQLVGDALPIGDLPPDVQSYLRAHQSGGTFFAGSAVVLEEGTGWRRTFAALRRELGLALSHAAPGDAGALLTGLVTGDDRALSDDRRRAFVRTGTTHVTAVSGANVALVVTMLTTLGAASGWRRRGLWQIMTVAAVWAYALLVGLDPPATRAAIVATGAVFARQVGRRPDFPTLLVLAAAIIAVVEPADLRSLSFRLSFASSLALALTLPGLRLVGAVDWVRAGFVATTVAQLATAPILLPTFGTFSLTAIPANLAIAPLVNIAFPVAALAGVAGLVSPALGDALGAPAHLCADAIFWVVDRLGGRAGWTVVVGEPSPPVTAGLFACAAAVVGALSGDGRTWARRTWREMRAMPGPAMAVAAGGGLGGLIALAAWLVTR